MGTLTTASAISSPPQLRSVVGQCHGSSMMQLQARPVLGLCARAHLQARPMRFGGRIFSLHEGSNPSTGSSHMQYASVICAAAALSARSEEEQTQTVISKVPTIIHLPGEKISPALYKLPGTSASHLLAAVDGDYGGYWGGGFGLFGGGFLSFLKG